MSGRRRRVVNNEDSESEDVSDEDTEGDNDSDDDEEEDGIELAIESEIIAEVVTDVAAEIDISSLKIKDTTINEEKEEEVKVTPTEILKRSNSQEQQADKLKREKNNRRRELRRDADSFSQAQKKNPSFVPLAGNFFLHDDRDTNILVEDTVAESQVAAANAKNQAQEEIRTR